MRAILGIRAVFENWRQKREFARLEQPVTGVTEQVGVTRCSHPRKFAPNLLIQTYSITGVSGHAGVSRFQNGTKFGHLAADLPRSDEEYM